MGLPLSRIARNRAAVMARSDRVGTLVFLAIWGALNNGLNTFNRSLQLTQSFNRRAEMGDGYPFPRDFARGRHPELPRFECQVGNANVEAEVRHDVEVDERRRRTGLRHALRYWSNVRH